MLRRAAPRTPHSSDDEGTPVPLPLPRPRALRTVVAAVALALVGSALVATPAPAVVSRGTQAVALGDSFASGEGLAPYRAGTDTATNRCHRSLQAHPELLDEGPRRTVPSLRSAACSGAVTGAVVADLPGDSNPDGAQLAAVGWRTRTVTLTVGGNDVGFSQVLGACTYTPVPELQGVVPGRPGCSERLDAQVRAATAGLAGAAPTAPSRLSLAQLLVQVQRKAPWARVYVTGYPRLFGLTGSDALGCRVGSIAGAPLYVSGADASWIRSGTDSLNAALRTGVAQARARGVRASYVDVAPSFDGHEVCGSGTPWINGVVVAPTTPPSIAPASFHPTARGQQAYAAALARAIEDHRGR